MPIISLRHLCLRRHMSAAFSFYAMMLIADDILLSAADERYAPLLSSYAISLSMLPPPLITRCH